MRSIDRENDTSSLKICINVALNKKFLVEHDF